MRPNFTKEQKQEVINDYLSKTISKQDIRKKYKIGIKYFKKILKEANIKNKTRQIDYNTRKYRFNEDYFEVIDTEDKAYFLGLLASDGHITHTPIRHCVGIALTDLDIIEKLKFYTKSESPIRIEKKERMHHKTSYRFLLFSVKTVHDLEKFNLCGRKSTRTHIPKEIPHPLIRHFIRGYFDGDGSIYQDKRRNGWGAFTITSSSLLVLQQIQQYLQENNIIRQNNNFVETDKRGNCFYFRTSRRTEIMDILNFLYKDATVFMERKRQIYLKLKNTPIRTKIKNATSKYFGVRYCKEGYKRKYTVAFRHNGKIVFCGSFVTEKEAVVAYNNKIKELGLPDHYLNKIETPTTDASISSKTEKC